MDVTELLRARPLLEHEGARGMLIELAGAVHDTMRAYERATDQMRMVLESAKARSQRQLLQEIGEEVNEFEHAADIKERAITNWLFTHGDEHGAMAATHMMRVAWEFDAVANAAEKAINELRPIS